MAGLGGVLPTNAVEHGLIVRGEGPVTRRIAECLFQALSVEP